MTDSDGKNEQGKHSELIEEVYTNLENLQQSLDNLAEKEFPMDLIVIASLIEQNIKIDQVDFFLKLVKKEVLDQHKFFEKTKKK
ncbi:MAG: hypothetical protein J7K00_02795 [Candidatus Diapherotrites archaeon]|nr:hypothetical protein [Candidatus Diapherotrites archaeon]